MYRWKPAGRREALVFITMMLLTPTISYILLTGPTEPTEPTEPTGPTEPTTPTETTTTSPEPDCKEGEENYYFCACDPQCARYGDCCRSSPYFVPEEQRLGASPFTCTAPSITDIYVMTTCPPDWKDSDTRNRCEHPDSSHRDPLLDAPLTSLSTNTTYQNWHCAYCHGDLDAATTVIWDATFSCYGSDPPTALSDETIAEHLSFNPLTSNWNLSISLPTSDMKSSKSNPGYIQRSTEKNKQETHYSCYLTFRAPAMELPTRRCNAYEVRRCSVSWEDAEVKAQCEAYTGRVCSGLYTYRNRHCLLCNHLDVLAPCYDYGDAAAFPATAAYPAAYYPAAYYPAAYYPAAYYPGAYPATFHLDTRTPFSVLLDWRRLKRGACASSEMYDPLSHVCRKVFI